jgi:hypothetical protein
MQNTSPSTPTLAETAQAMKQWRAQKKHSSEKMPDKLRSQIIDMLAKYQHSTVAQALRLSNSTIFALRQMQNNNSQPPQQADVDFIPFQLHTKPSNPPAKPTATTAAPTMAMCQIMHSNGAKLIINSNDVNSIIKAFLCCR